MYSQRKFAARKQQRESELVDEITVLERRVSNLGSENRELAGILASLKRLQSKSTESLRQAGAPMKR